MLEKVVRIDNVGVIRSGVPKALDLDKVTLIYADNARGKSTLSALLKACAAGDAAHVCQRKTVGATASQNVLLRFDSPAGAFSAEFDGTVWKGKQPNLYVFNQDFVEKNVYASQGVLPEQREALLDLALGDAAVAQRAEFDKQTALQRECAGKVKAAEDALQGFRGVHTVDQFIGLAALQDVDVQIQTVDKQVTEARDAEKIRTRPEFKTVTVPTFDFTALVKVAESSFEIVSANAEAIAKKHFSKHNGTSTERWVAEGLHQKPELECPFCGQPTEGVDLLTAYKSYFDNAYKDHLQRVASMKVDIQRAVSDALLLDWAASIEFNNGALSGWTSSLEQMELPYLDVQFCRERLSAVEADLLKVAEVKAAAPLKPLDGSPFKAAMAKLEAVQTAAETFNVAIVKLNEQIAAYKNKLAKPDVPGLMAQQAGLAVRKNRFETNVVALVDAVTNARADYKSVEAAKNAAKKSMDTLMEATLKEFQKAINTWLMKFGAPFSVKDLGPNYKGGGVRSEYVLEVRGAKVNVGPGPAGELSFHAALSEGDKRTLAFAFFLAMLFADQNRKLTTVVLDDVFTSLDHHRRHHTASVIVQMAHECAQVIVLGHDAHFLNDVRKSAQKKKVGGLLQLGLHRDAHNYSVLGPFDIDEFCKSKYYKHYSLVERFVNGQANDKLLDVAQALRPLVEGHLHRCFPEQFKDGLLVGDMLNSIKVAPVGAPLSSLQSLVPDLVTFNDFAAAYHHETAAGETRTDVTDAEVLHFAKGALGFIQSRKLW